MKGYYTTAVSVGTVLFTLEEKYRPTRTLHKPLFSDDCMSIIGYVIIATDGRVMPGKTAIPANTYILIDTSWFTE